MTTILRIATSAAALTLFCLSAWTGSAHAHLLEPDVSSAGCMKALQGIHSRLDQSSSPPINQICDEGIPLNPASLSTLLDEAAGLAQRMAEISERLTDPAAREILNLTQRILNNPALPYLDQGRDTCRFSHNVAAPQLALHLREEIERLQRAVGSFLEPGAVHTASLEALSQPSIRSLVLHVEKLAQRALRSRTSLLPNSAAGIEN